MPSTRDLARKLRADHRAMLAAYQELERNGLVTQRTFSALGALLAGMIYTRVGEAMLPTLVRRSLFPVPVAAATSTLVVAGTVFGASVAHCVLLAHAGGLAAIP